MTDHDERVARRYRELGREEPAAALDDAILAASRRAVRSRPGNRWAGPVSIAAVLVLGIGVSLRMQIEKPGIETSAPTSSSSAEYPVTSPAEDAAAKPAQAPAATPSLAPAPAAAPAPAPAPAAPPPQERGRADKETYAPPSPPPPEKRAAPATAELAKVQEGKLSAGARPEAKAKALADSAAPSSVYEEPAVLASQAPIPATPPAAAAASVSPQATIAPSPARIAPAPGSTVTSIAAARPAPVQAAPPAAAMPSEGVAALRAKREAQGVASEAAPARKADNVARDPRETELERIARLRAENRHEEADKALTEFRRINPDYRIPEALWERVKAR